MGQQLLWEFRINIILLRRDMCLPGQAPSNARLNEAVSTLQCFPSGFVSEDCPFFVPPQLMTT